jgi:molecular chaperone GrpE
MSKKETAQEQEDVKSQEEVQNEVEETVSEEQETEVSEKEEISVEEKLKQELQASEDKYLRLYSEFENFRKRTQKEKADLISASKGDTFKLILPILDDFDRALKSINDAQDVESLKEGVDLIHSKMVSTLKNSGLEEMQVLEQEFDAELHEAITNIPAPSEELKGKVLDVVEKGYKLNERIIRFPKVVVGN